jgi:leucyl aminopeptidase (aminopeptidase T)
MNERIEQIWEEAAKTTQGDSWEEQTKFVERLAELIVRECIDTAFHKGHPDLEFLLKHFGVKE